MNISKYKNIFFDRDGIINEVIFRDGIVSSPRLLNEFKFRQDFLEFIINLKTNHDFFVVTNQPDISRGLLRIDDLEKMHRRIESSLKIKKITYCPHTDKDFCLCRKPKPGMIEQLVKDFSLDKKECILIGDSKKDIDAAINAEIDHIYLKTRYNGHISRTFSINSLAELI